MGNDHPDADQNAPVLHDLFSQNSTIRILFLSPEKLMKSPIVKNAITSAARNGKITRFVFDEAHVLVQWGRGFRPEYMESLVFTAELNIPLAFFTATASTETMLDIIHNAGKTFDDCYILRGSIDRPNLIFEETKITTLADMQTKVIEKV